MKIMQADFSTIELRVMAFISELDKQNAIVSDLYRKAMECDRGTHKFMELYGAYRKAEEHLNAMQKAAQNTGRTK